MDRDELLKRLNVTSDELHDLLTKFRAFLKSLDKHQEDMVERSLPTMMQALAAFGGEVTEVELLKLFEGDKTHRPVMLCVPLHQHKSPRS